MKFEDFDYIFVFKKDYAKQQRKFCWLFAQAGHH